MAENETLAELLRRRGEQLINLPTEATRFLTDPQAFAKLLGIDPNQRLSGFSSGFAGVPQKPPSDIGVVDPRNIEYSKGYGSGEEMGMMTALASPLAPLAKPVGKALGKQAYRMTEDMLQKQGMMPSIVPRDVANEMGMATTLPTDSIFAEAVKNTPSAQITDEGLVINVMRKQKPEQSMTESVRSGVFYLPEGSKNIKHYGGTNPYGGYGGTEKITGETLYKNPLFVKGATGGKAPESAYAQLTSKADLKILQDDVFNAITGPKDIKYDLVEQFLEKHAPDLLPYSSYIYDNSRKGNQLRYALQEAAVAQKVRDAGYDAVIGHSKGKAGPFISEIFDVRESHYPNATGGFALNPKFEEMYQNAPVSRKDIIKQQINKLEPTITVEDRTIPVTLHPVEARQGNKIEYVNTDKFENAFKKDETGYIGKGGTENAIGKRYQGVEEFLKTAPSMRASEVHVRPNGSVVFGDGRHRYAFLRDQGLDKIPISMDADSIKNAKKFGYID